MQYAPIAASPATGPLVMPGSSEILPQAADPTVARPGQAVWVSTFPQVLVRVAEATPAIANAGVIPNRFVVPAPGRLFLGVTVADAVMLQWTVDAGITWLALNAGQAVPAGAWWQTPDPGLWVVPGDIVDVGVAAATTWTALRILWCPTT